MKKTIILFILIFLYGQQSFATTQVPDKIKYLGKDLPLEGAPLNAYKWKTGRKPFFHVECSCNWRGHVAHWEVKDGKLFLIGIDAKIITTDKTNIKTFSPLTKSVYKKAQIEDLFSEVHEEGRVFASWFTGKLRIGSGKIVKSVSFGGFCRYYDREIHLQIQHGVILSELVKEFTAESAVEEWRRQIKDFNKIQNN